MSGSTAIGSGSGQCLELIGSQVTFSDADALASVCPGSGVTSSVVARLVQ
jgi:hypothetical protein